MEKNHHRIVKNIIDGIEIFEVDFSKTTEDEFLSITYLVKELAHENVNTISFFAINTYRSPLSVKIIDEAKQQLISRENYAIYGIYGVDQFRRAIAKVINFTNNKNLNLFDSRQQTIDFLVSKGKKILDLKSKLEPEEA